MTRAAPARRRHTTRALLGSSRQRAVGLALALVLLTVCVLASLAIGSQAIAPREVLRALVASDGSDAHVIITELRVPRTEIGVLVGAALGAAGALMQGLTRNPLADPEILGINAGASLAVVTAIFALGITSVGLYVWFALAGAATTALVVYALATAGRAAATPMNLALGGAVVAAFLSALISAILILDGGTLDQFRFWVVGSLDGRRSGVALTVAPFIVVGCAIALVVGRWLNALSLGEDVARSLGVNLARTRAASTVACVLLAGGAVAAAGPVAFIGLTVPHIARGLVGADHRWIVPYAIVLGAALLLASDVLGRVLLRPEELEVGIVTALLGAPFFIWLVRRPRLTEL